MYLTQKVHFGIDDVVECLRWIYEKKPKSVFENPMLGTLKKWHEQYGLCCSLYVVEEDGPFRIDMLEDVYWDEFAQEYSWLKFSWCRKQKGKRESACTRKASFLFVTSYLKEKMSERSLEKIIGSYHDNGDEKFVEFLSGQGITVLLISDDEISGYCLGEECEKNIKKYGMCCKGNMTYWNTDLRWNEDADCPNAYDICHKISERVNVFRKKRQVISCQEVCFEKVQESLETLWKEYGDIMYDLYINVSTIVGDELYFTDLNTSYLYKKKICDNACQIVTKLKKNRLNSNFASMHFYMGKLWMLPCDDEGIIVYDIEANLQIVLELPQQIKNKYIFRRGIRQENYLWAVSVYNHLLVRINMDSMQLDILDRWPEDVIFSNNKKMDFKNICECEGKLYAFRDGCNKNIVVDEETLEIQLCSIDTEEKMAIVSGERVYMSPTIEKEPLRIVGLNMVDAQEEILLPNDIWDKSVYYAYWYCDCVGDDIYFLPHEANAILVYNKKTHTVSGIYPLCQEYRTNRPCNKFAGYEVHSYMAYRIIMAYQGNEYIVVDNEQNIICESYVKISLKDMECGRVNIDYEFMQEKDALDITKWINIVSSVEFFSFDEQRKQWYLGKASVKGENRYGKAIYRSIVNGF